MQHPLDLGQAMMAMPIALAEFAIGDQQYQVVTVAGNNGADAPHDGELTRFACGGCLCAIVSKDCPRHGPLSDLTAMLTERELQITALVSQGRLNKQIADQLHISEWTVATHLRRIFSKLGVKSRAAMVYRCAPLLERLSAAAARL